MTQLDLKGRATAIITEAEAKLRALVFEAAHYVEAELGAVELDLVNGEKAVIDKARSSILVAGQEALGFLHYKQILDALHNAPGIAGKALKDHAIDTEVAAIEAVDRPVDSADKALQAEAAHLDSQK